MISWVPDWSPDRMAATPALAANAAGVGPGRGTSQPPRPGPHPSPGTGWFVPSLTRPGAFWLVDTTGRCSCPATVECAHIRLVLELAVASSAGNGAGEVSAPAGDGPAGERHPSARVDAPGGPS